MLEIIKRFFSTEKLKITEVIEFDANKVVRINVNIFIASQDGTFRYQKDFNREVNVTDNQETQLMFSDFQSFLTSIIAKILKYRWN